ncbi:hypothetical protein CSOJ01_14384 [Colletotrichum sojae]|uniref:Uncharacterized protein n=1 Tax=Colletotrichum sojae TaxID=2175907 RepID=A0A8H6MJE1_9PEZI|nr:hypothetical protein CSOJ01_14384 [Colletotrichum sojae]
MWTVERQNATTLVTVFSDGGPKDKRVERPRQPFESQSLSPRMGGLLTGAKGQDPKEMPMMSQALGVPLFHSNGEVGVRVAIVVVVARATSALEGFWRSAKAGRSGLSIKLDGNSLDGNMVMSGVALQLSLPKRLYVECAKSTDTHDVGPVEEQFESTVVVKAMVRRVQRYHDVNTNHDSTTDVEGTKERRLNSRRRRDDDNVTGRLRRRQHHRQTETRITARRSSTEEEAAYLPQPEQEQLEPQLPETGSVSAMLLDDVVTFAGQGTLPVQHLNKRGGGRGQMSDEGGQMEPDRAAVIGGALAPFVLAGPWDGGGDCGLCASTVATRRPRRESPREASPRCRWTGPLPLISAPSLPILLCYLPAVVSPFSYRQG